MQNILIISENVNLIKLLQGGHNTWLLNTQALYSGYSSPQAFVGGVGVAGAVILYLPYTFLLH